MTYITIGKIKIGWVEFVSISLLILGIIVAFLSPSAMIYYIVSFITGVFFGRIWYKTRNSLQFKYFIIITAFIIGFIIGNSLSNYGDPRITIIIYIIGVIVSYYVHQKHYIHAIDY